MDLGILNWFYVDQYPGLAPVYQSVRNLTDLKSDMSFDISPVNVPEGPYNLYANVTDIGMEFYSPELYVFSSSDTSCLPAVSSVTSAPSTTSSITSTSGASSGVPDGDSNGKDSGLSRGAIAGTIVGVLAGIGALVGALLLVLRCRSRTAPSAAFGTKRRFSRGGFFEKNPARGSVAIDSRPPSTHNIVGVADADAGLGVAGLYRNSRSAVPGATHRRSESTTIGVSNSEDDVASLALAEEKPVTHAPSIALDTTVPGPITAVPLIHRNLHAYRNSQASTFTDATIIPSPYGASKYSRQSHQSQPQQSTGMYSNAIDPFETTPPSTPSRRPSEVSSLSRRLSDPFNPSGSPNQSQVPVALFEPSSNASSPRSVGSPGVPRDISVSSVAESDFDADIAAAAAYVGRSSTPTSRRPAPPAPAPALSRRTMSSRKPVPVYAPSVAGEALELVEPATPRSATSASSAGSYGGYYNYASGPPTNQSHVSGSGSGGGDWSSVAAHSHSPATGSPMSSGSHLPPARLSSQSTFGGEHAVYSPGIAMGHASIVGQLPELNHKSSFGDRPMHYLIPDPPPDMR